MTVDQKIEIIRLIASIIVGAAIPIVIFIIGNKYTKTREIEEKLRSDRIDVYNHILEPFMLIFSTEEVIKGSKISQKDKHKSGTDLASDKLLTIDYQQYAFKLSLLGSDQVVRAFNNLMQAIYHREYFTDEDQGMAILKYTAILLLEIRKSLGNEKTKIHALEMLEWKIKDVRENIINGKYPEMEKYYKSF